MTLSPEFQSLASYDGYTVKQIHDLPKRLSHIKERVKIQFIRTSIGLWRRLDDFGKINFENSILSGGEWDISYKSRPAMPLEQMLEQIMTKGYFGNRSVNENVYFYRNLNIIRSEVSPDEWEIIQAHFANNENNVLSNNTRVYMDYREKLDRIERMLLETTITSRES